MTSSDKLTLLRFLGAVGMSLLLFGGCFVVLTNNPDERLQTAALELITILVTGWVTYYAAVGAVAGMESGKKE